jgi:hypothetical protein
MKIMNNPIYLTIGHVIMIHLFGQIYFFRIKSVLPTLQKHYITAKSDVAAQEKSPTWWNRIYAAVQIFSSTLKSLFPVLQRYIYNSVWHSEFLHRNFPAVRRHFSKWIHDESESRMGTSVWNNGNSR